MTKVQKTPFEQLKSHNNIYRAWRKVRENGIKSNSTEIKDEVYRFDDHSMSNIRSIASKIEKKTFRFQPSIGIEKERENKLPRPIVLASLETRIIQRTLLDILNKSDLINSFSETPNSFGGIKKKGVKEALLQARIEINSGNIYYVKTDISDFFTKIPKLLILEKIKNVIKDDDFMKVLIGAMDVELSNIVELKYKYLFPIHEIGVAQGCALSPLFGNILLNEFDKEFNSRGIKCLRYIDDLLILGKGNRAVKKAFRSAKNLISSLNLELSDDKTEFGLASRPFNFLGWSISTREFQPSKITIDNLLKKIEGELQYSLYNLKKEPVQALKQKKAFVQTLDRVNSIVSGWSHQYRFCTNWQIMYDIDEQIDKKLKNYKYRYNELKKNHLKKVRNESHILRNMLGVLRVSEIDQMPLEATAE